MGEKSAQKKKYILDTARKVFVEKGFKSVTMKDIVEACEISRGGLYLYFESTDQILMEVLQMEADETDDVFTEQIAREDTAADILTLFLKEQKKELLQNKDNLTVAVYEYFFAHKPTDKNNMLRRQFDAGVKVIEKLIETGIDSGEFYCENPKGAAANIMYVLEGLKINAQTFGITEKMVDEQLLYIMQGLITEI
ncbi:MAG: TetR/AcrR family transcriptional regulator [Lachnospiraceae bacterium]|jgi:AcrR family transcriptional regulator|nr:TetR/AcrR family transcriptional regulator [Lachnospiraceae bacterium]MCI9397199.1 TetR/AcrR family transcriptional regulator [Lachnospiraceae bacterium]